MDGDATVDVTDWGTSLFLRGSFPEQGLQKRHPLRVTTLGSPSVLYETKNYVWSGSMIF